MGNTRRIVLSPLQTTAFVIAIVVSVFVFASLLSLYVDAANALGRPALVISLLVVVVVAVGEFVFIGIMRDFYRHLDDRDGLIRSLLSVIAAELLVISSLNAARLVVYLPVVHARQIPFFRFWGPLHFLPVVAPAVVAILALLSRQALRFRSHKRTGKPNAAHRVSSTSGSRLPRREPP